MKKYQHFILIIILLFPYQGISQDHDLIRANPGDLDDSQSLFINPAVVQFQNYAFNLGMKVYHWGFLSSNSTGLKHSFLSGSLPNILPRGIGVGATMETFYTPYYHTLGVGISLGYTLSSVLSLGINATGYNKNYHFNYDNVIDPDDPLFAKMNDEWKRWDVSFGTGLLVRPDPNFTFGISCRHLNRPDLSISDCGARMPMAFDFGIKYYYNIFGASVFANYQQNDMMIAIIAEADLYNKGILKAGYYDRSLLFEGQLKLLNGISLQYRMEYPIYEIHHYSSGSHQLGISWNMKPNRSFKFNVKASVDTIKVVDRNIIYRFDTDWAEKIYANDQQKLEKQLISYLNYTIGEFSNESSKEENPSISKSLDDDPRISINNDIYAEYREYLEKIVTAIKKSVDKNKTIDIYYHDELTAARAVGIKNYIVYDLDLPEQFVRLYKLDATITNEIQNKEVADIIKDIFQKLAILKAKPEEDRPLFLEVRRPPVEEIVPKKIFFHITNPVRTKQIDKWRIVIKNIFKQNIHIINGVHEVPDLVEWDGFKVNGTLPNIGNYSYYFQYYSLQKSQWLPKEPTTPQRFVFINEESSRTITITPDNIEHIPQQRDIISYDGNNFDIFLKNPKM